MARGKRRSLDEQLESIEREMECCNVRLQSLQQERQEMLKAKRDAELSSLYDLLQTSGKTVEELTQMLQEESDSSQQEQSA